MVKPLGEDGHSWLPPAATDLFNDVLGLADTRLRGLDTALVHAMVKNHQATQPLPEGECERGKFLISLRLRWNFGNISNLSRILCDSIFTRPPPPPWRWVETSEICLPSAYSMVADPRFAKKASAVLWCATTACINEGLSVCCVSVKCKSLLLGHYSVLKILGIWIFFFFSVFLWNLICVFITCATIYQK